MWITNIGNKDPPNTYKLQQLDTTQTKTIHNNNLLQRKNSYGR